MTVSARQTPEDLHEAYLKRFFELEGLSEGLTSGRLCGISVPDEVAQLILVLLERLDWTPDAYELVTALPHFPERLGLAEIRSTLANLGFPSTLSRMPGHRLSFCPTASLVCDEDGELWLIGSDSGRTILFRPEETSRTRRVSRASTYRTVQFEQRIDTKRTAIAKAQIGWTNGLFSRFGPEKRLAFVLTLGSGLASIAVAFGISKVFDTVIPSQNHSTLVGLLIGLGLVALTDLTLRRTRAGLLARVSGRVEYVLSTALFAKLMRLPAAMLAGAPQSEQFSRLKQFETVRDLAGGPIVLLVLELALGFMLLAAVAVIAWQLAALLAALAALFLAISYLTSASIRRATQSLTLAQSSLNEAAFEMLAKRTQIRRDGLFDVMSEQLHARLRDLWRARRKLQRTLRFPDALASSSMAIAAATVIGTGAILAMQGTITTGQLIAATILTWRLFAPIQQSLKILPKLPDLSRLLTQIDALFQLPEEDTTRRSSTLKRGSGDIKVRNLVMRFPNSIAPVLMGVNFDIPSGAFVTVTGRSGSGNSTLLRLLAGNVTPQAGVVLIDGLNLAQLSRSFRNRNIAYVPQEPMFFFGTVAQNLRLVVPDAPDEKLMEVVGELGLENWVNELPDGLDTRIDPTTMRDILTPGLRTMIGIAQALLMDAPILLLDEPAGGLEPDLEQKLLSALTARHRRTTVVMVTHRPSLIRQSDLVILLKEGTVSVQRPPPLERVAS